MKLDRILATKVALVAILVYGALIAPISAEDGKCPTCGESLQKEVPIANSDLSAYVDILPGVCPNVYSFNGQGLLAVAVLGTKDFDVRAIDPSTISLTREGSSGEVAPFRWHYGDVTAPFVRDGNELCGCRVTEADGRDDLILEFDIYNMIKLLDFQKMAGKNAVLKLTGHLQGKDTAVGSSFEGSDCINVSM